jgi:hypothetical protein
MGPDPAETLAIFFATGKERIDRDLASVPDNLTLIIDDIKAHGLLPPLFQMTTAG